MGKQSEKTTELLAKVQLMSGFVFKSVFGENLELCRQLLEVSLGTKIERVEIAHPEHELQIATDRYGGRLDLYVVDASGNYYDVEVQAASNLDEWMRARRYQALVDALQLKKGSEAKDLRDCVVVFICDFDPFERGLVRYDCHTVCEQTGTTVPDGRASTYLNVRGPLESVDPALASLLSLFRGVANEDDAFVRDILNEMEKCASDAEWMEQYMTFKDELEAHERKGWMRGHQEGLAQGLEQGLEEGLARSVRALVAGGMSPEEAMDALGLSLEERAAVGSALDA